MGGSQITPQLMLAVMSCTIGASFQYGFHVGFVNNAVHYVQAYYDDQGVEYVYNFDFTWACVVSAFAIGGALGTFVVPSFANKPWIGRKKALLFLTIPCYMSCGLIALAPRWEYMIFGRFLVGFGSGGSFTVLTMYISEISPKALRGGLGTVNQLLITIGIFVSQAIFTEKFGLLSGEDVWQYSLLLPMVCNTVLVMTLPLCPDSPPFLFKSKGESEAREALQWFRKGASAESMDSEIKDMQEEANMGTGKSAGFADVCRDKLLWKQILVGMFVNMSMQLSGIDGVLYYSTGVFDKAGMTQEWAQVSSTLVGLVNVIVTIPAMFFMDSLGRKFIQSVGLGGMCLSYASLTLALVCGWHKLAVLSMVMVIVFFAFGPGCVGWFIVSELCPIHARAIGTSIGLGANFFANWFIGFVFPFIHTALGNWCFSVFLVTTFVLTVFTMTCVPETKGKSIAEVSEYFMTPPPRSVEIRQDLKGLEEPLVKSGIEIQS